MEGKRINTEEGEEQGNGGGRLRKRGKGEEEGNEEVRGRGERRSRRTF